MIDYNKRLVEVSTILNHLSKNDYNKIPEELIKIIEENKDKEYVWDYNETKDLENQDVSRDTIAILTYINMQYLLNEKQREFMQKNLHENQKKIEEAKREKYNPDDLFKNKNSEVEKVEETVAMVTYKESIFTKIKNWFKRTFQ